MKASVVITMLSVGFVSALAGGLISPALGQPRTVIVINDPLSEYTIGKRDFDAESDPQSGRQKHLPLSENPQWQQLVDRVGQRIAAVAAADTDASSWTFVVRKNKTLNAHAHPGGFICVNEGMLTWLIDPKTGKVDEGGLAAVLAHEVAHVTRQHFSNALKQFVTLQEFLRMPEKDREEKNKAALSAAFSRANESEADQYGSLYLIRAGYNFSHAVRVWQAMLKDFGDGQEDYHDTKGASATGAASLSTHPGNRERIEALMAYEAMILRPALERFNLGEELLRSNSELELAVEIFRGLKQNFPNSAEVRNNLAVALHKLYLSRRPPGDLSGQPDLAVYSSRELSEKIRLRARGKGESRLLTQSIEEYKASLAAAANPRTMSNLAWALIELGDEKVDQAQSLLAKAAELTPQDPYVLNARGMVEQKRRNLDKAIEYYTQALKAIESSKDETLRTQAARYNLGWALLQKGDRPKAVDALRAYLTSDPVSTWGQHVRAHLVSLGEKPPEKPSLPAITEFAGIPLSAKKEKVVERFGQPAKRGKGDGNSEQWSYPDVGLEFLIVFDAVQRITQERPTGGDATVPLPVERKILGIGLDDPKSKVESVLGKGALRKSSDGVQWLTYEANGVDFALSEGRVFAFMVRAR